MVATGQQRRLLGGRDGAPTVSHTPTKSIGIGAQSRTIQRSSNDSVAASVAGSSSIGSVRTTLPSPS